jgi:cytoskeletal protein RodZ
MISQETKISLKVLECIEEEAFENLPALVYLKGFLRGYAQSLGLDPQKVIEEYLRLIEESKKK